MWKRVFLSMVLIAAFLAAPVALSHGGATGIVKERMDAMDAMKDAMKSLKAMILEGERYDAEAVRDHAETIRKRAAEITELFPEGSLDKPTEALPAIWESWDRFAELSQQLEDRAEALKAAADGPEQAASSKADKPAAKPQGSAFGAQRKGGEVSGEGAATRAPQAAFKRLTQVCRDCHEDFRRDD